MRSACLATALVLSVGLSTVAAVRAQAGPRGYQGPVFEDPALMAPEAVPLWRDRLDAFTAVVGAGRVYYPNGGRLVAADLATGRRAWTYAAGTAGRGFGPTLVEGGYVVLQTPGEIIVVGDRE